MIIETLLLKLVGLLSIDSFLSENSEGISGFLSAFRTILHYIDYLDPIVPIPLLISCAGLILVWTVVCCLVRLVIDLL